ncbi:hypothetical protein P8625_08295 [Tenacibaculum tangerinum]|uniref:Uncharacterized protein n=1 Tax=Tenacibaculum tangerinum TaxID=3038772 RepID=A0ABY8KYN9_9FLAO|nr:hypothetical protein [Tenacibaculum tangerinum]WGH74121.1 hypothetical protein P8625_08295 [Tenacibaculum tangerinum]
MRRIILGTLIVVLSLVYSIDMSLAQSLTYEGDTTICLTAPTAPYHCVANEDGSGDTCSKTSSVGPACSNTAKRV